LRKPKLKAAQRSELELKWQCALASLAEVDRGVAEIRKLIGKHDELGETVFLFVSDNGYFFGEHRILNGKVLPYEEAIHLPFRLRVPPAYLGGDEPQDPIDDVVGGVDVVPTLLDLAGASPCTGPGACRILDGRSLMPLVAGGGGFPADRSLLLEYSSPKNRRGVCEFVGVRRPADTFIQYISGVRASTGECEETDAAERYDLDSDPFQLQNLCAAACPDDPAQDDLTDLTDRLRDCAGIAGRDPLPASGHYCD